MLWGTPCQPSKNLGNFMVARCLMDEGEVVVQEEEEEESIDADMLPMCVHDRKTLLY